MGLDLAALGICAAAGLFVVLFPLLVLSDLRRAARGALRRFRTER